MDPVTPTPQEPKGKVLASYLVRVTLRQSADPHIEAPLPEEIPTNDRLAGLIAEALYHATGFLRGEIHVTSERTDR